MKVPSIAEVPAYFPRFRAILDTARRRIREGEGISHEDFWRAMDAEKPSKARVKQRRKTA